MFYIVLSLVHREKTPCGVFGTSARQRTKQQKVMWAVKTNLHWSMHQPALNAKLKMQVEQTDRNVGSKTVLQKRSETLGNGPKSIALYSVILHRPHSLTRWRCTIYFFRISCCIHLEVPSTRNAFVFFQIVVSLWYNL